MPRYVLLLHETPPGYPRGTHYDLMLEQGGALRTWALESLPEPGHPTLAERLRDHRTDYLDFAGEITGGRGSVERVDYGSYDLISETADQLRVRLCGTAEQREWTIAREADSQRWWVSLSDG